jgi:hypothetical protein
MEAWPLRTQPRAHQSPIAPCAMSRMTKGILKRLEGLDG